MYIRSYRQLLYRRFYLDARIYVVATSLGCTDAYSFEAAILGSKSEQS